MLEVVTSRTNGVRVPTEMHTDLLVQSPRPTAHTRLSSQMLIINLLVVQMQTHFITWKRFKEKFIINLFQWGADVESLYRCPVRLADQLTNISKQNS